MRAVRVELGPEKRVLETRKNTEKRGKTRTAKSMRVNDKNSLLLQNSVLFKMSDESEHSESEFYYPGELPVAELLQSPTHSESIKKRMKKTNEEDHK